MTKPDGHGGRGGGAFVDAAGYLNAFKVGLGITEAQAEVAGTLRGHRWPRQRADTAANLPGLPPRADARWNGRNDMGGGMGR